MWIDDDILKRCAERVAISIWVPENPIVVIGNANVAEQEVYTEFCRMDQVPILQRYGGGGAVVLHPGCLILSFGCWVKQTFANKSYFQKINQSIIDTLSKGWPELASLSQQGLSDICSEDQKIAGTSLFRSRNYLLYQASLLVEAHHKLMERYLRHPSREPDYRASRNHRDFVVGLADLAAIEIGELKDWFQTHFEHHLLAQLETELVSPCHEQYGNLLKRSTRAADAPVR